MASMVDRKKALNQQRNRYKNSDQDDESNDYQVDNVHIFKGDNQGNQLIERRKKPVQEVDDTANQNDTINTDRYAL